MQVRASGDVSCAQLSLQVSHVLDRCTSLNFWIFRHRHIEWHLNVAAEHDSIWFNVRSRVLGRVVEQRDVMQVSVPVERVLAGVSMDHAQQRAVETLALRVALRVVGRRPSFLYLKHFTELLEEFGFE